MLSRRKNFARRSFTPAQASVQQLTLHLLPMCQRIHRRGKLERGKSATVLLMKRKILEGF